MDFTSEVCKGLQKLIGYEPLSRGTIMLCKSPENSQEQVYFPHQFAGRISQTYVTSKQNNL